MFYYKNGRLKSITVNLCVICGLAHWGKLNLGQKN
jgi:hypothetical protein